MSSSEFINSIASLNPVYSSDGAVESFGDHASELLAATERCSITPLSKLSRIVVTGNDRRRFLHNFCTNNINDLATGQVCEAFFVDVKARVIAHGYVAAADEHLEIWMLPGDESALLQHLDRYIVTDDVALDSQTEQNAAFAVVGPDAKAVLENAGWPIGEADIDQFSSTDDGCVIQTVWNGTPLFFVSTAHAVKVWNNALAAGAIPAGSIVFDHIRILERFPIVGVDVSGDNIAPEADRIKKAISYTKGCYLGQEPIARIDALGHVNRKLFGCTLTPSSSEESAADLPLITSRSRHGGSNCPALIQLSVKMSGETPEIIAKDGDGSVFCVTLTSW